MPSSTHTLPQRRPLATGTCCPVVEFRRYTLHPGTRDSLITLFDREFIESQEAVGMRVIAQFRDLDAPDAFVWLRGFPDMPSRAESLRAFYDGPVWAEHRDAANATMIAWNDVRLLRPARPDSGFALGGAARPGPESAAIPPGLVVATIYTLGAPASEGFTDAFERAIVPALVKSGAPPIAAFETEPSVNTFPRLPVREGEHAFVWFARFANLAAYERHVEALEKAPSRRDALRDSLRDSLRATLDRHLAAPADVWRLAPTARSLVPGAGGAAVA
ncbi:MAG TPA: NIPSNAP family protein [Gemmatimonadaceae bacterium]